MGHSSVTCDLTNTPIIGMGEVYFIFLISSKWNNR